MAKRFKRPPRKPVAGGYAVIEKMISWYEHVLNLGPEAAVAETLVDPDSGRRVTRQASKVLLRTHIALLE